MVQGRKTPTKERRAHFLPLALRVPNDKFSLKCLGKPRKSDGKRRTLALRSASCPPS